MRIPKGKTGAPTKPATRQTTRTAQPAGAKPEQPPASVDEQALLDELARGSAPAARLKTVVERLLGAGDDAEVRALVKRLKAAGPVDTAPGYRLPDE